MKKLTLERQEVFVIQRRLKEIPPRLYPTTQEIKITTDKIIPAMAIHVEKYLSLLDNRFKNEKLLKKEKITEKEFSDKMDVDNKEWEEYHGKHGDDDVVIELEDDAFNVLHSQFEREDKELGVNDVWGRSWTGTIEDYSKMIKRFEEAETVEESK